MFFGHSRGVLAISLVAGCAGEPDVSDAGTTDALPVFEDASVVDARPRMDAGPAVRRDAGFEDPYTLFEGPEDVGGVRIYVHLRGSLTSTQPPVLLINTGPSIGHEYLVEPMDFLLDPPGRLVVLFDLRATGRSGFGTVGSTTTGITVETHVEDVENMTAFLDDHGVDTGQIDLVGHGYGGAIAAHYARRHPDRARRLVMTAPYPATILQHALYNAEVSARLSTADRERFLAITREPECFGNVPMCSLELWNIIGPHLLCESNRYFFDSMVFEFSDFRAGFIFIDEHLRDTEYDWTPLLSQIATPTTIISGPCDPIGPDVPLTYEAQMQNATHLVLLDTGHFPMVEAPAAYQAAVLEALR